MNPKEFIEEKKRELQEMSQEIENMQNAEIKENMKDEFPNQLKILRDKKRAVAGLINDIDDRNKDLVESLSLRVEDSLKYLNKSIDNVKSRYTNSAHRS